MFFGLDVGQARDPAALAGVVPDGERWHARHLERLPLGTSYAAMVARAASLAPAALSIDATGVGRAVHEMAVLAGLPALGVTITGGRTARQISGNALAIPKVLLFRPLMAALSGRRIAVPGELPGAGALAGEMMDFTSNGGRIDVRGRGHHGDLVTALALAMAGASLHAGKGFAAARWSAGTLPGQEAAH